MIVHRIARLQAASVEPHAGNAPKTLVVVDAKNDAGDGFIYTRLRIGKIADDRIEQRFDTRPTLSGPTEHRKDFTLPCRPRQRHIDRCRL